MNIRTIGSYEITIFDANFKRIKEVVSDKCLFESKQLAEQVMLEVGGKSYTVAKIIFNSKFDTWGKK